MLSRKLPTIAAVLVALAIGTSGGPPAAADPPPPPPNPSPPNWQMPRVFCFRVTDIKRGSDPDHFLLMFEVLNWTGTMSQPDSPAYGLYFALNRASSHPFASADVKNDGRPFDAPGDLAQFAALSDVNVPASPGQPNNWSVYYSSPTSVLWFGVDALENRPLLAGQNNRDMCQMVPGCHLVPHNDPFGTPVIPNPESIDNGDPSVDGQPNNVLDGFVIEVVLPEGELLSFNWFLVDANLQPIGVSGHGSTMGWGTFNIFRPIKHHSRPLWGRMPGVPEYNPNGMNDNQGTSSNIRDMFVSQTPEGDQFEIELGSALTAPFLNPEDNVFKADITAQPLK